MASVAKDGVVKDKTVGMTTITVKSKTNPSVSATCILVVKDTMPIIVTSVPTSTPAIVTADVPTATVTPVVTKTAEVTEVPTVTKVPTVTPVPTVIYSGSYEKTSWTIDSEGCLEVKGTGECKSKGQKPDWCEYARRIESVIFSVTDFEDASYLFYGCQRINSVDWTGADTSKVTNMSNMFASCYSLMRIDLSELDTSNVTNMSNMFCGCKRLKNIDINPTRFDTSNVTDMSGMFINCFSLLAMDVSGFDTS